ncbi:hypothetical protein, partial [Chlorogloeopsis sp. ULAP02]|uniref:hypothetical protein n=1 Tax=Chlorogloeopsis sp. ULAP02 TaxID=3107926 RepID=UPI00398BB153
IRSRFSWRLEIDGRAVIWMVEIVNLSNSLNPLISQHEMIFILQPANLSTWESIHESNHLDRKTRQSP